MSLEWIQRLPISISNKEFRSVGKTKKNYNQFDDEYAPYKRSSRDDRHKIHQVLSSGKDPDELQEELDEFEDLTYKLKKRTK